MVYLLGELLNNYLKMLFASLNFASVDTVVRNHSLHVGVFCTYLCIT